MKLKYPAAILFFLLTLYPSVCQSQSINAKTDSLRYAKLWEKVMTSVQANKSDSIIYYSKEALHFAGSNLDSVNAYKEIAWSFYFSLNLDSALFYANRLHPIPDLSRLSGQELAPYLDYLRLKRSALYRLFKYHEAHEISLLERSLALKDSLNWKALSGTCINLSIEQWRFGNLDESMKYAQEALFYVDYSRPVSRRSQRVQIWIMMGLISYESGRTEKAIDYYLQAATAMQDHRASFPNDYISNSNNLANAYQDLNQPDKALAYLKEADQFIETLKHLRTYPQYKIILTNNIADNYMLLGDFESAHEYYEKALQLESQYLPEIHYLRASTYYGLSEVKTKQERFHEAIQFSKEALSIRRQIADGKDYKMSAYYYALGDNHWFIGNYETAYAFYDSAIMISPGFNEGKLSDYSASQYAIAGSLKKLVSIDSMNLTHQSKKDSLLSIYSGIIAEVNQSFIEGREVSYAIDDFFQKAYQFTFDLHQKTPDESLVKILWEITEYDKSRRLLTHLNEQKAFEETIPADYRSEQKLLKDSIEYYTSLSLTDTDSSRIRLIDLKARFESLKTQLATEYPEYYELKYNNEVLDISQVQKDLDLRNESVIEYYMAETDIYITSIDQSGISIEHVALDSVFFENLAVFQRTVKEPSGKDNHANYIKSAYYLYSKLIFPFKERIQGKKLIIVPSGELTLIPFEALLTAKVENTVNIDFKELPYLLKEYSISYANSITMLYQLRARKNSFSDQNVLAFSPTFTANNGSPSTEADTLRGALGELLWANEEVKNIANYFPTSIYQQEEANEAAFKKYSSSYSIIHLASHAVADDKNPMLSKVFLTYDNTDSINDGYLHTFELVNAELTAEMAVLSACDTGYGKIERGEGVMSLAQGFFYSGVSSVIMSLWPANDKSTSEIMNSFYAQLADGKTKSEALREAKLLYLNKSDNIRSHPFFWSQFVANGNMRPIASSGNGIIYLIIPLAMFLLWLAIKRFRSV